MSKGMKEKNEKGFTLVELMIAMVISALVMASVYSVYYTQQKSYIDQEEVAAMHQNLRAAMYFMEREIRMAGCDPTGNAGAGIVQNLTSQIRFTEDVRGKDLGDPPDGAVKLAQEEDISYYLVDGNLVRDTNPDNVDDEEKKDMVIAENISSLTFTYLNSSGGAATGLSDIRLVQVQLMARNDDGSKTETLQTRIHARNLGI